jgi:hypothetical protein
VAAALALLGIDGPRDADAQPPPAVDYPRIAGSRCAVWEQPVLRRNPTEAELRCRYGTEGPGRFGLSVYMEVPVYQPATPLPGTHVVGVPVLPGPAPGESFEAWEWRMLRTEFGPAARQAHRSIEVLHPTFASMVLDLEHHLREAGVPFHRRETWRAPERQAYLFQQGRSRPGPLVTATLTSWHSVVDGRGHPSATAADYTVPRSHMVRFHEIASMVGLGSYGADSNDPGHVYLPGTEAVDPSELQLLRLLPRVPVVTLSTGRPTDEIVDRSRRAEWRQAAHAFAWEPFFPAGRARLAAHPRRASVIRHPLAPAVRPDLSVAPPARGYPTLFRRRSG